MSDDEMSSDLPTKVGDPRDVDDEIDAFAEDAFDALMMEGEGKKASAPPEAVEAAANETGEYEDVELDRRSARGVVRGICAAFGATWVDAAGVRAACAG